MNLCKSTAMVPTFDQLPSEIQELKDLITSIYNDVITIKSTVAPVSNQPLGIEEASAFLSCRPSTLYKLARTGKVNSFKRLKKCYFFKHDLIKYLENGASLKNDKEYVESHLVKSKNK